MDNMMQVGMAFGTLLERILVDLKAKLEAKLIKKSIILLLVGKLAEVAKMLKT